jgi:hypothetical protein
LTDRTAPKLATELYIESLTFEDDIDQIPRLFDQYRQSISLIQYSIEVVKSSYAEPANIRKQLDAGFTLIPALISGCFCVSSIYFERLFELFFSKTSKSKSFASWYEYNQNFIQNSALSDSEKLSIFNCFTALKFRHKLVVHGLVDETPGYISGSDGSFQLCYGTNHHMNIEDLKRDLDKIRISLEKKKLATGKPNPFVHYLNRINNADWDPSGTVQYLFFNFPYTNETSTERETIDRIAQKFGCNSMELRNLEKVVDEALPAMHRYFSLID